MGRRTLGGRWLRQRSHTRSCRGDAVSEGVAVGGVVGDTVSVGREVVEEAGGEEGDFNVVDVMASVVVVDWSRDIIDSVIFDAVSVTMTVNDVRTMVNDVVTLLRLLLGVCELPDAVAVGDVDCARLEVAVTLSVSVFVCCP